MDVETNPLLIDWDQPHALPPFARVHADHFRPALERAMRLHKAELAAIATNAARPDFDNTIAAFDRAAIGPAISRCTACSSGEVAEAVRL